jgi:hypothetical protein
MLTRLAVLALVLGCAVPSVAHGQGSPFAPLPPSPEGPAPTQTQAPLDPSNQDDGLETWQELLIYGAGGVLLLGIGWAIVADARRAAPVKAGTRPQKGGGARSTDAAAKARARARARAKAARRQRKRSR